MSRFSLFYYLTREVSVTLSQQEIKGESGISHLQYNFGEEEEIWLWYREQLRISNVREDASRLYRRLSWPKLTRYIEREMFLYCYSRYCQWRKRHVEKRQSCWFLNEESQTEWKMNLLVSSIERFSNSSLWYTFNELCVHLLLINQEETLSNRMLTLHQSRASFSFKTF